MVEKKLPKMFANKIEKELNNNKKVFYSKESMQGKERDTVVKPSNENNGTRIAETKNIYQKINDIFTSEKYVYKANVNIKTKTGNIKTKVIGQNKSHLITFDNQLIAITEIEDIEYI